MDNQSLLHLIEDVPFNQHFELLLLHAFDFGRILDLKAETLYNCNRQNKIYPIRAKSKFSILGVVSSFFIVSKRYYYYSRMWSEDFSSAQLPHSLVHFRYCLKNWFFFWCELSSFCVVTRITKYLDGLATGKRQFLNSVSDREKSK